MSLCVQDFLRFDYFKSLEVIAGAGGLSRSVSGCGILDYEMEQELNRKYADQNFHSGQLVITSLLFAKNNPFLIRDAVKYVISKGGSGLVIKNVFRLPIHESILRYADSRDFPILIMNDMKMFFEDFIIQTNKCIEIAENAALTTQELNDLLYQKLNAGDKNARIRRLFPIFRDQYALVHFRQPRFSSPDIPAPQISSAGDSHDPAALSQSILHYEKGFFLFLSGDSLGGKTLSACISPLAAQYPDSSIGVSGIHYRMEEADTALREAIYASRVHQLRKLTDSPPAYLPYAEIGVYRVLLPLIDSEALQQYSRELLDPLLEFDAENHGSLLDTLLAYVQYGGDLHALSAASGQHENTLRYRLDRIGILTGLNCLKSADYEQLALAAQVYLLLQS